MLIINNLKKSYEGVKAVNDVSFSVDKGDIYGFLGPNGAGKTTTIRMIMGIIHPDSGGIELNGNDINSLKRQTLGYLPEDRGLYQKQKLEETCRYFGLLRGLDDEEAKTKSMMWLERFGLKDQRNRKIEELSKGNQQKIQFILSLLHDPELIIMDEPFTGLEPLNQLLLKEKIQDQITNTTRFLVIGNEFPGKTSEDKTSISLSLKNEQGALLKVLQIVNKNKINLTNILSRPVKKNKWQYSFFLEFSGHASDKNVSKLFKELQKVSYDLKVLGSYPAAF